MFLAPRRLLFEKAAALQSSFVYFFTEFIPGNDPASGGMSHVRLKYPRQADLESGTVAHASELALLFGPVPTSVEDTFANQMLDFWIHFVADLNPGGKSHIPCDIRL
jgi:hypothetical protein